MGRKHDEFDILKSSIKTEGCWLWTGAKGKYGYGHVVSNKIHTYAHRVSYEQNVGNIPNGFWVLHKCDNPSCIRPDHLFLGNQSDNMVDMYKKGRWSRDSKGERNSNHKFTERDIHFIRTGFNTGLITNKELADLYGTNKASMSRILRGRIWKDVLPSVPASKTVLKGLGAPAIISIQ